MTTLFVATTGGHLTQLHSLADRIPPDPDAVWVTHANEQSTSLLADRDVEYIPYVGVRDVRGVLPTVRRAHALYRRRRPTRAVSTHRLPDEVTVDDLLSTLSTSVRRVSTVPPFELQP